MSTHGVAITVPEPYGSMLQQARERAGDPLANFIPPHVTLLPPTEIEKADLAGFEKHLGEVASRHSPFRMHLHGTGTFRPLSPVVFVQVSVGIPQCELLETDVRSGPVVRDLEFNYHPHVTIAHNIDEEALDRAFEDVEEFRCAFEVRSFELYHQGDDGVWRPLTSFPLEG
ncbi:phosphoesterase [Knoellia sinensis KCTC 19936]|uniref:Phosphoesterase n=1 Tax=Knoellia sinensis KCTC 19936 TaxID=1385520 RepID=A0A0A0IX56_9MICO|nr:2'-5' RNA ligase family protein [Knoellia sinensis]KGN29815.1 phosphoesterase [Knoellia sinensis KCTC 19936]